MMKKLINSDRMAWFRKRFLKKIYIAILSNSSGYCCRVKPWESIFICWKDLKEVKENMNSDQLIKDINGDFTNYTCENAWFWCKEFRLLFLEECLSKFKK